MRLIDSDALKEQVESHVVSMSVCLSMGEHYGKVTMREDCLEDITNAPTIDAIPVEWLQKMRDKMNHAFEPHFAFMYVLQEWERTKTIEELQAESEMRDWKAEQEDEKWAHD